MSEYTERWRATHNLLAKFGDDLLSLRDLFKAAAEAEALLARKDEAVAEADRLLDDVLDQTEKQQARLDSQAALVAEADAALDERKCLIDADVEIYRQARIAEADASVAARVAESTQRIADLTAKAQHDLTNVQASLESETLRRDTLLAENAQLVDRNRTYDTLIAEKAERLAALERRLSEIGKLALGAAE